MWDFVRSISLLRYLIIWRVNRSLVQLPRCLSTSLSLILGTIIAERLPTQQAREWHKALAAWESPEAAEPIGPLLPPPPQRQAVTRGKAGREAEPLSVLGGPFPETGWPLRSVLLPYPAKRAYGQGELILWELKLLGPDADHGLFLETILPAMEAAATTSDERWHRQRTLWGRFDIHAIYVAHGARWEPLVRDGRLDLSYRPTATQWAEGLPIFAGELPVGETPKAPWRQLNWITPFDLAAGGVGERDGTKAPPSLEKILDALLARLPAVLPGKRLTVEQVRAMLPDGELAAAAQEAASAELAGEQHQALVPAPKGWPGRWAGVQIFKHIPPRLLPYLELAAILHIGRHTHFGCGTFNLSAARVKRR